MQVGSRMKSSLWLRVLDVSPLLPIGYVWQAWSGGCFINTAWELFLRALWEELVAIVGPCVCNPASGKFT